jgi:hypothetical protein
MKIIPTLLARIFAVFGSSALAALAGGAIMDISLAKSAGMAGFMAAAGVTERLLRAYYDDGQLSTDEISDAFGAKK